MRLVTRQQVVALWHYQCPQCGIGSADTGAFAVADTIYCEVCIEDGQPARLRRWPVEESQPPAQDATQDSTPDSTSDSTPEQSG